MVVNDLQITRELLFLYKIILYHILYCRNGHKGDRPTGLVASNEPI